MVRQWQKHFYEKRYSESVLNDNPDFVKIAEAYGIKGVRIEKRGELAEKISEIIESREKILVHVLVDPAENIYPIIPVGKSNSEMLFAKQDRDPAIFENAEKADLEKERGKGGVSRGNA
jgi:acetolactate synthase-1/2/3 large subunit